MALVTLPWANSREEPAHSTPESWVWNTSGKGVLKNCKGLHDSNSLRIWVINRVLRMCLFRGIDFKSLQWIHLSVLNLTDFSQKFHEVWEALNVAICLLIVPESTTGSALSLSINNNKKRYNFKLDYGKEKHSYGRVLIFICQTVFIFQRRIQLFYPW